MWIPFSYLDLDGGHRSVLIIITAVVLLSCASAVDMPSVESCDNKQILSASMIYFNPREFNHRHHTDRKVFEYVRNFTKDIFSGVNEPIEFKYYPPVFTQPCDKVVDNAAGDLSKGRGSNIAHKEVWDQFYRNRRNCTTDENNLDRLMVFEYDAYIGMPDAGARTVAAVKAMTTDLLYLGYCFQKPQFHPTISGRAPYCLHAYALTVVGAKKLVDLLDNCGAFADAQLADFCNSQRISWSVVKEDYDHGFVNAYFTQQGIHLSGYFTYGGIIVQAKYDAHLAEHVAPEKVEDGLVVGRGRALYLLRNNSWHLIPDMDTYNSLGHHKRLVQVSEYQLRTFPMGDDLPRVIGRV